MGFVINRIHFFVLVIKKTNLPLAHSSTAIIILNLKRLTAVHNS